jgi:hypothetical protein
MLKFGLGLVYTEYYAYLWYVRLRNQQILNEMLKY